MVATQASWGLENEEEEMIRRELSIASCTEEQLGLVQGEESKSLFYTINTGSSTALQKYKKRLNCIGKN